MTLDDRPTLPGGLSSWLPFEANLSQDEHNVSWRGGLNYKPARDALIYALVSRGYKAGGVPTKQVLAYYLNFLGLLSTYQNLPTAEVEGVDIDVALVPISGLTIRPAVTYLHSRIGSFATVNAAGQPVNVGGNRLSFAPNTSASVDAEYDMQLGGYVGFIGANAQIESGTFADLAESPETKIPGYSLFDVRVGARSPGRWNAFLWVHNLSNHYYWTNIISAGDVRLKPTGLPRTFGVTVGVTL